MIARALLALLALTFAVHMADRVATGFARCHPHHCIGGPKW